MPSVSETRLWPQMPRKYGHFAQKRSPVWDYGYAWLGRQDSNLGMVESKSTALPLGDAPAGGRTIMTKAMQRKALIGRPEGLQIVEDGPSLDIDASSISPAEAAKPLQTSSGDL